MTDNKLSELKETAGKILTYNRLQILNKHPFIGNIAMNLNLVPIRDARCNSAMTDGSTIYFDIDFMSKLNSDEIQFVLGHEIWHVVMLHFLRADKRDHNTFNIACDMEVNQILELDGFIPPTEAIFPNNKHSRNCKFNFSDGLSAEEYYDLILKWRKESERNEETIKEVQNEDFDDETDKMNPGMGDESDPNANSDNNQTNKPSKKKSKKNNQKCEGQFDKHFDQNENQDEALKKAMEKGAEDKYGAKEADVDYQPKTFNTESEVREASEKVREMVIGSAQNYERTRGELPGHIKKYVDKLLESKLPWKEILASFITTGMGSQTNWNSPNRRFAYSGTYLPRHDGDMMRIAVGIDTSGSCEKDCEKFLSEVNGIAKGFDQYELHVIQCDTEVKDYTVFDQNNPLNADNKIEFKGFGGTELHPIFQYMDLNDVDVDAAVIFTDGYCEKFDKNEFFDIPILWIITGTNPADNIEVGQKVYMAD